MLQFSYVLKISAYPLFVCILYVMINKGKLQYVDGKLRFRESAMCKRQNLSYTRIFVLSFLFGVYSIIVSVMPYASDRRYYAVLFGNSKFRYQLPVGYAILSDVVYLICSHPNFLFFSISFLMVAGILCIYRKYEYANVMGLLLLFCSTYFIYGFHLLKQGIAVVIAVVALIYAIEKKYIWAIVFSVIAISFHESAILLLLIFVLFELSNKKLGRILIYASCTVGVVGFGIAAPYIAEVLAFLSPHLANEMKEYFSDLGTLMGGMITTIKGLPVYIIAIVSIIYRDKLCSKIKNYDKYVVLVVVMSTSFLLSAYMYWMYRFGLYCAFLVYMFWGKVLEFMPNKKIKKFCLVSVYGSTFLLTIRYLIQMFFIYGGF